MANRQSTDYARIAEAPGPVQHASKYHQAPSHLQAPDPAAAKARSFSVPPPLTAPPAATHAHHDARPAQWLARRRPSQPPPQRSAKAHPTPDGNPYDPVDSAASTPASLHRRKSSQVTPRTPPSGLLLASLPEGFDAAFPDGAGGGGNGTPEALQTARSDCSTVATGVDSTRSRATCNNEAAILSIFEALGATAPSSAPSDSSPPDRLASPQPSFPRSVASGVSPHSASPPPPSSGTSAAQVPHIMSTEALLRAVSPPIRTVGAHTLGVQGQRRSRRKLSPGQQQQLRGPSPYSVMPPRMPAAAGGARPHAPPQSAPGGARLPTQPPSTRMRSATRRDAPPPAYPSAAVLSPASSSQNRRTPRPTVAPPPPHGSMQPPPQQQPAPPARKAPLASPLARLAQKLSVPVRRSTDCGAAQHSLAQIRTPHSARSRLQRAHTEGPRSVASSGGGSVVDDVRGRWQRASSQNGAPHRDQPSPPASARSTRSRGGGGGGGLFNGVKGRLSRANSVAESEPAWPQGYQLAPPPSRPASVGGRTGGSWLFSSLRGRLRRAGSISGSERMYDTLQSLPEQPSGPPSPDRRSDAGTGSVRRGVLRRARSEADDHIPELPPGPLQRAASVSSGRGERRPMPIASPLARIAVGRPPARDPAPRGPRLHGIHAQTVDAGTIAAAVEGSRRRRSAAPAAAPRAPILSPLQRLATAHRGPRSHAAAADEQAQPDSARSAATPTGSWLWRSLSRRKLSRTGSELPSQHSILSEGTPGSYHAPNAAYDTTASSLAHRAGHQSPLWREESTMSRASTAAPSRSYLPHTLESGLDAILSSGEHTGGGGGGDTVSRALGRRGSGGRSSLDKAAEHSGRHVWAPPYVPPAPSRDSLMSMRSSLRSFQGPTSAAAAGTNATPRSPSPTGAASAAASDAPRVSAQNLVFSPSSTPPARGDASSPPAAATPQLTSESPTQLAAAAAEERPPSAQRPRDAYALASPGGLERLHAIKPPKSGSRSHRGAARALFSDGRARARSAQRPPDAYVPPAPTQPWNPGFALPSSQRSLPSSPMPASLKPSAPPQSRHRRIVSDTGGQLYLQSFGTPRSARRGASGGRQPPPPQPPVSAPPNAPRFGDHRSAPDAESSHAVASPLHATGSEPAPRLSTAFERALSAAQATVAPRGARRGSAASGGCGHAAPSLRTAKSVEASAQMAAAAREAAQLRQLRSWHVQDVPSAALDMLALAPGTTRLDLTALLDSAQVDAAEVAESAIAPSAAADTPPPPRSPRQEARLGSPLVAKAPVVVQDSVSVVLEDSYMLRQSRPSSVHRQQGARATAQSHAATPPASSAYGSVTVAAPGGIAAKSPRGESSGGAAAAAAAPPKPVVPPLRHNAPSFADAFAAAAASQGRPRQAQGGPPVTTPPPRIACPFATEPSPRSVPSDGWTATQTVAADSVSIVLGREHTPRKPPPPSGWRAQCLQDMWPADAKSDASSSDDLRASSDSDAPAAGAEARPAFSVDRDGVLHMAGAAPTEPERALRDAGAPGDAAAASGRTVWDSPRPAAGPAAEAEEASATQQGSAPDAAADSATASREIESTPLSARAAPVKVGASRPSSARRAQPPPNAKLLSIASDAASTPSTGPRSRARAVFEPAAAFAALPTPPLSFGGAEHMLIRPDGSLGWTDEGA